MENWKALIEGKPIKAAFEFPLFTDAHITGEITKSYGPYQLLNTAPIFKQRTIAFSIILMFSEHLDKNPTTQEMDKSDTDRYHGGWLMKSHLSCLCAVE